MTILRALQREFVAGLFDSRADTATLFRRNGIGAVERFDVYRNNLQETYRATLADVYPVVQRLVGEEFFRFAAHRYLRAVRSTSGNLNEYGAEFADFLENLPEAFEHPYLGDIARLEWARQEVFYAASSPALRVEELAEVAGESDAGVYLGINKSSRLIASAYPIQRIWEVCQEGYMGDQQVDLDSGGDRLWVTRSDDFRVGSERIAAGEYAFLDALANRVALRQAVAAALCADPRFDLGAVLAAWVARGVVVLAGTEAPR